MGTDCMKLNIGLGSTQVKIDPSWPTRSTAIKRAVNDDLVDSMR